MRKIFMFIFLSVSFLEIIYGIFEAMYGYRGEFFFTFFGLGLLFLVLSIKQKEKSEILSVLASLYFGFGSLWFGVIYLKGGLTSWLFVAVGTLLIILALIAAGYYSKRNGSKNVLILFSLLLLVNMVLMYYEVRHTDYVDLKYNLPTGFTLEYRLKSETKVGSEVKRYVSKLLMEVSKYTSGKYEIVISTNSDVSNIMMDSHGNIMYCNNCYPILSLKPILLPALHRAKLEEKWITHLSDSGMYETERGNISYDATGNITYTFEGVDKISTSLGVFKCYLLSVNGSIHVRGVIYTNSTERIPFTTNESFKGLIAITDKGYILEASYEDSITQLLNLSYSYKNLGFLEDFYREIKSESHIDVILVNKSITKSKVMETLQQEYIKNRTTNNSNTSLIVNATTVFFFYSSTCSHCEEIKPYITNLTKEYSEIRFVYCDVNDCSEECREIMEKYRIMFVPTVVVIGKNNTTVLTGSTNIKNELEEVLNEI